jgi:hypothetical protein
MMQTVTAINAVVIRCSVDESESLGLMAILQVFVGLGHPWYPLLTHGSQLAIMGLVYPHCPFTSLIVCSMMHVFFCC